ncbi:protein sel-1 homolog 3 [Chanos chanos]|uniref:Protein sel-1 homolog 3 n=1 Tax=Chanos chanos TaxID=29144 RepID=A0A6J2WFM3_CHACN|nr:protein sel-1 homolog 3-like [Chanos chanos]
MKVLESFQCELLTYTITSPSPSTEEIIHGDFVQFDFAPDVVVDGSSVQLQYQCSRACEIQLEVLLSTVQSTGVKVFRKRWTNLRRLGKPKTLTVALAFPACVTYRRDFFVRQSVDVRDVMLRAWLNHLDRVKSGDENSSDYHRSLVRTFKILQTVPPSERPVKPRTRCPAWDAELTWKLTKDRVRQCPHESDTVDLLTFPFVSTGENFGVIRTFKSFINRDLERVRIFTADKPRVTVSVWMYLLDWCSGNLCGIVKHLNEHQNYTTPLIMLTNTGKLVVQARFASGEEHAFTVHAALPLRTWIRLDCFIQVSKANIKIHYTALTGGTVETSHTYNFQKSLHHNDTTGYFVIGGDKYMTGIHGYFGPIKYYRLGSDKVVNPLAPRQTLEELDRVQQGCENMREVIVGFLEEQRKNGDVGVEDVCLSYYEDLRKKFGQKMCKQTWTWEQQRKHGPMLKFLHSQQDKLNSGLWSSTMALRFGQRLFDDAVRQMTRAAAVTGLEPTFTSWTEMLQVASCWGHDRASLLLATTHLAGLGVPVDWEQGHVYSLIGAVRDDRLALLHLGYKHMQGLDGFPKDYDMAYGYYANVGRQTSIDREKVQDSRQYMTEHVHLSNEEEVQNQMSETGDVVQYLKLQAERGDIESQKTLARMLFWGQNGVTKDIAAAVQWYARGAMQMTDPIAMYDYAILLLKGTGVKKNTTLGLKLMEKAAAMGFGDALNGLGWYYSTIRKNETKAMEYFELAAQNGSRDGIFNLGVYHLRGLNPHKPGKNETAAFHCFFQSAQYGHVEGAVEAASYLSTGALFGVSRDPLKAVILLKNICERNGFLGFTVREALKTYMQGSWEEALVKYAMLAETGLGVAQNNAAHLCEELKDDNGCQWRYHNYSTYNHAPHPSGLLKMGDRYCQSEGSGDMVLAVEMYSRAALAGSPEALYNLAVLTEDGYEVPENILELMQISAQKKQDRSEVVEKLLLRCIEFEDEENISPCSLALLRIQMRKAWSDFTQSTVQLALASGIICFVIIVVAIAMLHSLLAHQSTPANHLSEELRDHQAVNHGVQENGLENSTHEGRPQVIQDASVNRNIRVSITEMTRTLQETADLFITATGVCLCALCTIFLSHLL